MEASPSHCATKKEDAHHIFGFAIHRTAKALRLPPVCIADEAKATEHLKELTLNKTKIGFTKAAQHHLLVSMRASKKFKAAPQSCFSKQLEICPGKLLMASELVWEVFVITLVLC